MILTTWWIFPLVCTLLATLFVGWVGVCSRDFEYADFITMSLAITTGWACAVIWLLAFLAKLIFLT